jgi:protein-S-isoprenylcysteine O-methyltransferase Ste14
LRIFRVLTLNIFLSLLAILLMFSLFQLDVYWPSILPGWLVPLALRLFILGGALIIWAAFTLLRHAGSSGAPGDPTHRLVAVGPYRWTRNPIYAGDVLLVFGVAFFTRSPSALVIAILLPVLLHWYVCRIEEPKTEARLGDAYREYKQNVPRWFPKLRKIDKQTKHGK